MSNQRPAKKQSRPDILGQDMGILKFFKIAQKVLEKEITPKAKKINNKRYICGGYLGMPGDIVVDNTENPSLIYGYIFNKNIFIRDIKKYDE